MKLANLILKRWMCLLCSPGECIAVNFGASPFTFNLEAMLLEEREGEEAAVQR